VTQHTNLFLIPLRPVPPPPPRTALSSATNPIEYTGKFCSACSLCSVRIAPVEQFGSRHRSVREVSWRVRKQISPLGGCFLSGSARSFDRSQYFQITRVQRLDAYHRGWLIFIVAWALDLCHLPAPYCSLVPSVTVSC
jgi:hypothetical protein